MANNTNNTVTSPAPLQKASNLLYGFDVQGEASLDFLSSLIVDGRVPEAELAELMQLSLLRGQEEWDMIFACARALRERSLADGRPVGGLGLEPFLAHVLAGRGGGGSEVAALGQKDTGRQTKERAKKKKNAPKRATSRFWTDEKEATERKAVDVHGISQRDNGKASSATTPIQQLDSLAHQGLATSVPAAQQPADISPISAQATPHDLSSSALDIALGQASLARQPTTPVSSSPTLLHSPFLAHYHTPTLHRTHSRSLKSPFFIPSPSPSRRPRPARGTISSLPFPPLSCSKFGLIQETLTHDPFRLLIAVTFLIKTTGKAAIPVFHRVMERFPTPEAFLREEEEEAGGLEAVLLPMIERLGLGAVRCRVIRRYARGWVEREPERGRRWRVGGYPGLAVRDESGEEEEGGSGKEEVLREDDEDEVKREVLGEVEQSDGVENNFEASEEVKVEPETPKKRRSKKSKLPSSEWEIGHLTQGRYAIDSWRIFCRDIFLGKSDNWMGRSQDWVGEPEEEYEEEGDFEPEWKRVLPEDKELRACLRWMWMRQGFEWDPVTGRRSPLREEMRLAVEEGRVKYDERGELVIVEETLDVKVD